MQNSQMFFHKPRQRSKAELNRDSFTVWLDGEESFSGPWRDESGLPLARSWVYEDGTVLVTDADGNEIAVGHLTWGDSNPKIAARAALTILVNTTSYGQGEEINYVGFARQAQVEGQMLRVVNFVKERPLAQRSDYQRPPKPTTGNVPRVIDHNDEINDDLPDF